MWSPSLLLALLPGAQALNRGIAGYREFLELQGAPALHAEQLVARDSAPADNHGHHGNGNGSKTHRFHNDKTEQFLVKSLPLVNFDYGELYSGLIPIGTNESEALFFVFAPRDGEPVDELTIWLNGGPGCSSLEGWLQETGRISWQPGTYAPTENPYSWDRETNMIWVEQPIGTGFSIGTPRATTQEETAQDFLGFFKNFQDTFGIQNFKIYITGESYAGRYIPYIASAMIDANNTCYYDISGALIYDGVIGAFTTQQEQVVAYPHVEKHNEIWGFNDTFMAALKEMHQTCGYEDYINKYLTFPPPGIQPPLTFDYLKNESCDVFDLAYGAEIDLNPCFNIYEIVDHCPFPFDPLASPAVGGVLQEGAEIYFRRPDVIEAMHAPKNINWSDCSEHKVYLGGRAGPELRGDLSLDPIQHVLPKVIEHTNRVLVANADWDYIIITDGTLLAIQNMTWNGALGFQQKPNETFFVEYNDIWFAPMQNYTNPNPQGTMGVKHFERGLMWNEVFQAGHMVPQYQPRAALKQLRWLLGRIDDL